MGNENQNDARLRELIKVSETPVELLARNPAWVFADRPPNPIDTVSLLVKQLLSLGCKGVEVHVSDAWFAVSSSTDWMRLGTNVSPVEQFISMIPITELGSNQLRVEVALSAFAEEVITYENGLMTEIKIDGAKVEVPEDVQQVKGTRVIAFRFPKD